MLSASQTPPVFSSCSLETFVPATDSQRAALEAAHALVNVHGPGDMDEELPLVDNLVLVGPPGTGKTHLAAAIAAAVERAPFSKFGVSWVNVPQAISDLRTEMHQDEHETEYRLRALRSHPGLVVLDDLGREKSSDWTAELVYVLVNARYESTLPTVVTSNLSPRELRDSGYWQVISRLAQYGRLIEVTGPDHRLAKR